MTVFPRETVRTRRRVVTFWTPVGFLFSAIKLAIWPLPPLEARLNELPLPYASWLPDSVILDSLMVGLCFGGFLFFLVCYNALHSPFHSIELGLRKGILGTGLGIAFLVGLSATLTFGFYPGLVGFLLILVGVPLAITAVFLISYVLTKTLKTLGNTYRSNRDRPTLAAIRRWFKAEDVPTEPKSRNS